MRDYKNRLKKVFYQLSDSSYFTDDDIANVCKNPNDNWDRLWLMVSLKAISIDLISRSFPIKQLDSLAYGGPNCGSRGN